MCVCVCVMQLLETFKLFKHTASAHTSADGALKVLRWYWHELATSKPESNTLLSFQGIVERRLRPVPRRSSKIRFSLPDPTQSLLLTFMQMEEPVATSPLTAALWEWRTGS